MIDGNIKYVKMFVGKRYFHYICYRKLKDLIYGNTFC